MASLPSKRSIFNASLLPLVILLGSAPVDGQELHERIDRIVAKAHFGDVALPANDYEFGRRVYLNLVGRIPTAAEIQAFADSDDRTKRIKLIDRLIASLEFDRYFTHVLDVMFMERRAGSRIEQQQWLDFLADAITKNWSFDRIVQAIVTADGNSSDDSSLPRGAAKFLVQREVESNALTRDIGRIFLGRDLQCAQCHDHPNITDYEQSEYYGILAFVSRSYLFEDPADSKKSYVGEKADGQTEFKSVFSPEDDSSTTIPRLLGELSLDVEPSINVSKAYLVSPTDKVAGVPMFSRRAELARLVTHPENEYFSKNIANRFWAHMMGRGIVHPIDFHHSDNPPSHPKLLEALANEFVSTGFDYRKLLREIALSQTYQRSIDFPEMNAPSVAALDEKIASLEASLNEVIPSGSRKSYLQQLRARRTKLTEIDSEIAASESKLATLGKEVESVKKASNSQQKRFADFNKQVAALTDAVAASKKVSQSLPKDQDLAKVATEYEKRLKKSTKSRDASKAKREEQEKELADLLKRTGRLEIALGRLRSKRIGYADMVAEARGALAVFRRQNRSARATRNETKQTIAALNLQRDYLVKRDAARQAEDSLRRLAAAPIEEAACQRLSDQLTQAEIELAECQSAAQAATEAHAATSELVSRHSKVLAELSAAIKRVDTAIGLLPSDAQLQSTLAVLTGKQQSVADQLQQQQNEQTKLAQRKRDATSRFTSKTAACDQLREKLVAAQREVEQKKSELLAVRKLAEASKAAAESKRQAVRDSWERRFVVRSLVPLSPEQLAGSTVAALQLLPRYEREATSEWQKANAPKKENTESKAADKKAAKIDEGKKESEIAALTQKRIDSVLSTYVSMFAAPGGSPQDVFSATADQALFLANDGRVQGWLSPSEETLLKELLGEKDDAAIARRLYLSILSRPADDVEVQETVAYLASRGKDRSKAIRELAWGLISSIEFRFNH